MTLDRQYVADTCRLLRVHLHNLTQEDLAERAHLAPRTVQKVESGTHTPDIETLRRIAKACGVGVEVFHKPALEEIDASRRALAAELRSRVLVAVTSAAGAPDILAAFAGGCQALTTDLSSVEEGEALSAAASLLDEFHDCMDIWSEMSLSDRVEVAKDMAAHVDALRRRGFECCLGRYRQISTRWPDLVFQVVLVCIRPVGATWRYALAPVSNGFETHPDDRRAVPSEWASSATGA